MAAYDDADALIQRYVPGAGLDDYAAYTSGTGTITRQWPLADPLGSVIGLSGASGAAGQVNSYDEYGVPAPGNGGRFGYAGALRMTQTGPAPWHMRNRQYQPTLGRFLQTDPIGIAGGVNLYGYVGNDPVNLTDPWGVQEGPPAPTIVPCAAAPHPSMVPGRCVETPEDCTIGGGTYIPATNQCVVNYCTPGATCITDPFEVDRFLERFGTGFGQVWADWGARLDDGGGLTTFRESLRCQLRASGRLHSEVGVNMQLSGWANAVIAFRITRNPAVALAGVGQAAVGSYFSFYGATEQWLGGDSEGAILSLAGGGSRVASSLRGELGDILDTGVGETLSQAALQDSGNGNNCW